MAGKAIAVRKRAARLSGDGRGQLVSLIGPGKRSARLPAKARILLKADVSEAGDGWSDSVIAAAVDTSAANTERPRRQLAEQGTGAVLTRNYNRHSVRPRIFGGAAEARLIALTCGPAPAGYARWTLGLLEEKAAESNIVAKARAAAFPAR